MTDVNGWLDRAKEIAQERAAKKAQDEAARQEAEKTKHAEAKLQNIASDMQFFSARIGKEFTECDVVAYEGDWPVFRLDDMVNLVRKTNGAVVIYRRAGFETSNFASLISVDVADNVLSLLEIVSRCAQWVDEQIATAEAEAAIKAEQERKRQERAASKVTEDAATEKAMSATSPAITIRNLDQMLLNVKAVYRLLKVANHILPPFNVTMQLEALEMLRQLVDSANEVAAKLDAEKAVTDDMPF